MPPRVPRAHRTRRAFTLIELLVTMAVIAILAGILLPVINRARTNAKIAATKNLLTQITNALTRYDHDWGDYPPDWIHAPATDFHWFDTPRPCKYASEAYIAPKPTIHATAEALYYYLANRRLTRSHPYIDLQADVQYVRVVDNAGDNGEECPVHSTPQKKVYELWKNDLRQVADAWQRPFLYNRRQFSGSGPSYFNFRGPIHADGRDKLHSIEYDLYSVGPNGQTNRTDLPKPVDDTTLGQFNSRGLDTNGYGDDEDDIGNWD